MSIRKMLLVGAMAVLAGCSRSQPGGGANRASTFTIHGPAMATAIPQGEERTVSLSLDRGSEFKQDVKLRAEAPPGVDATLSEKDIKPSEKADVSLRVAIGDNVAPGEHVVHITGTPVSGTATSLDVKIKVEQRNSTTDRTKLTLRGPTSAVTLKQGETKDIKISLEPNSKYTTAVKLHAEPPNGLKAVLTNNGVKAADNSSADLRITAEKNTAPGEYTVRIQGTGDAATVQPVEVRVKVVAP